jgi:hypothetical protein
MLHPELFLTEAKFLDKKMACLEGNKYIGKINTGKLNIQNSKLSFASCLPSPVNLILHYYLKPLQTSLNFNYVLGLT